jgi:alkylated DNA repair protein (DNA oxidative demethylase)
MNATTLDLFAHEAEPEAAILERIAPGAMWLRGWAGPQAPQLLADVAKVLAQAPLRHMVTPGGFRMSVAMSNCGALGWVTDRTGYRYAPTDLVTGQPWPAMPDTFAALARAAAAEAGFPDFEPDACLINRYEPGARMSLHQDRNERDFSHPIVSVSLGLPAVFQFGGAQRSGRPLRLPLVRMVMWWCGAGRHA